MNNSTFYSLRQIEEVVLKCSKQFPVIALTGPRQSGKSTLLKHIFEKTHRIVSFDDPILRERAFNDPKLFIKSYGDNVVFDEIQYCPELLSYIKILVDEEREKKGRFILTGSQQFHLMHNIGDTLAGRVALLRLFPLGIKEKKTMQPKEAFVQACLRGSYPELVFHKEMDSHLWYSSYLQTYLERDVRGLYNIGNLRDFQQFLRLLASRCSQILNYSHFARELGISVNTIKRWISLLEASNIIYLLMPYYKNFGKRITKSPKVYFFDIGLVCYLTGISTEEHVFNGPFSGALFENFIIQEMVKHFCHKGEQPQLYYMRLNEKTEIDVVLEKDMQLYPFEIKLSETPNLGMANNFEKSFELIKTTQDKVQGQIICLSKDKIPLTQNVGVVDIGSLLGEWNL